MGSITHGTKQKKKRARRGHSVVIRVMAVLLALLFLIPFVTEIVQVAYAVTSEEIDALSSQQEQLESEKQQLQGKLDKLNQQENSAVDRCGVLNDQIDLLNQQVDNTQAMVDDYNQQIKANKKKLKAAKEEEAEYYDLFCQRVRNMEENGSTSYWQILFGASDFSDLLDRASFVSSVMEYDNSVLDGLEQARKKVDEATTTLEEKKAGKEKALKELEQQQEEINATAEQAASALEEIRSNQGVYSAQLSQMEAQTEELAQEIVTAKSAYAAQQKAAEEEAKRQQEAAEAEQRRQEEAARQEQERQEQERQEAEQAPAQEQETEETTEQEPVKQEPAKEPEPEQITKPSTSGAAVVSYAMQFIGGKYVWGGANLATGVDCSGFVMCVYQHFGYSLPHYSESLAGCGKGVSYSQAQPGDIICYYGHCGIYIGGGMMVNALGAKYGIVVSQVNTGRLTAVRRIV